MAEGILSKKCGPSCHHCILYWVSSARRMVIAPQIRESDRIRRALSFMPSTKERPTYLQFRTNSLRRESADTKKEDSSEQINTK